PRNTTPAAKRLRAIDRDGRFAEASWLCILHCRLLTLCGSPADGRADGMRSKASGTGLLRCAVPCLSVAIHTSSAIHVTLPVPASPGFLPACQASQAGRGRDVCDDSLKECGRVRAVRDLAKADVGLRCGRRGLLALLAKCRWRRTTRHCGCFDGCVFWG